ncbi:unnamed protein product [Cylindrotheca closterium]|uniref:Kinesin light chain n=1 Tax=Cylindrotheca closterium TaxID=2856 RepID=A0AAD2JG74_9STRA|nr:unnamed protein product [Cylindrotheca closterium]
MKGNSNEQSSVENLMAKYCDYSDQGNNQKAKEILERVLELQTKEFDSDDLSVAETLHRIGDVLEREEKFDEALEKYNRTLAIRLKRLGEKHADTADTYETIGNLFLLHGNNSEKAEAMLRKALDINLEIQPENISELTDLYQMLALSLQKQLKFSEATKVQKQILSKLLQIHGEDHPSVVLAYQGIYGLLLHQDRFDDALQMIDEGIKICSRLQGPSGFDNNTGILMALLYNKAKCLEALGNFEGETEVSTKLVMLSKERLGEMHPLTADAYEHLAETYVRQDLTSAAMNQYASAIRIRRRVLGDVHPSTRKLVATHELLKRDKIANEATLQGLKMKAQGDFKEAMQLFHKAMSTYAQIYIVPDLSSAVVSHCVSAVNIHVAAVHENISDVFVELGLLEHGVAASAEALKIRRRTFGDDDASTKRHMETHRSLLKLFLEHRS